MNFCLWGQTRKNSVLQFVCRFLKGERSPSEMYVLTTGSQVITRSAWLLHQTPCICRLDKACAHRPAVTMPCGTDSSHCDVQSAHSRYAHEHEHPGPWIISSPRLRVQPCSAHFISRTTLQLSLDLRHIRDDLCTSDCYYWTAREAGRLRKRRARGGAAVVGRRHALSNNTATRYRHCFLTSLLSTVEFAASALTMRSIIERKPSDTNPLPWQQLNDDHVLEVLTRTLPN